MTDVLVFLKRIRRERHELKVVQETAAELRAMLLPSAIRYDKDRVQTSPVDIMPERIAEIAESAFDMPLELRLPRSRQAAVGAKRLAETLDRSKGDHLLRRRT